MAFNGSGLFARLYNFITDRDNGIKIRADRMDAELDGIADGLSNCITKDGQTGDVSADISLNSHKLTNVADPTSAQDAATKNWVETVLPSTFSDSVFRLLDDTDGTKAAVFEVSSIATGTTRIYTLPDKDGTVAMTSDIVSSTVFSDASFRVQDNGDASRQLAFQLSGLTADTTRTVSIQDSDGTLAYLSDITATFSDGEFRLQDDADATKQIAFQLSGITAGAMRTVTVPDASGTLLLEETLGSHIASQADLGESIDLANDLIPVLDASASNAVKHVKPEDLGGGGGVDVQEFTSSGTWTKPAQGSIVVVWLVGAGGGGASGEVAAAGNNRTGGGGGGGGGVSHGIFSIDELAATEAVTIGAGGTGGAANTSGNGNSGSPGSDSQFGSALFAGGGGWGAFFSSEGGGGGGGLGNYPFSRAEGGDGIHSSGSDQDTTWYDGGAQDPKTGYGGGGGGGGGISTSNTEYRGGNVKFLGPTGQTTNSGGTTGGGDGTDGTPIHKFAGSGGSGGGPNHVGDAGAGGNGAYPGGGGGGSGSCTTGFTSPAAGDGANGYCLVITY